MNGQSTKFSFLFLTMVLAGAGDASAQKVDQETVRNHALKEADQKAFEENIAAYHRNVKPFLQNHCVGCHGPKKLEGDLSLELLDPDMKESVSAARWAVVRDKLQKGEMPPDGEPPPAKADVENVLEWIKAEMKRSRRNFTRRLQTITGNHVPHELLFDPDHKARFNVLPRIRRKSADIYESFRKDQAKGFENLVGNPLTPDQRFIFRDMGSPQLDEPTTAQLLRNALTIVARQLGHTIERGKLKPVPGAKKDFLKFVDPDEPLGHEEMTKAIAMQFQRTLGRSPQPEELKRFQGLMAKTVQETDRSTGVRYTLAAVFLLPEAIFRFEIGGVPDEDDKARLKPREIADAIAYALTDDPPPRWLIAEAENGGLDKAAGVAAAVRELLDDEKTGKPRILRFFHEYFEYPKAETAFKNPEDFREHKARILVEDTDNLVRWILEKDQNVLLELLTTNRAFVNTRYDANKKQIVQAQPKDKVHLSYSLPPDWKWTAEQPIKMPEGTRAGILTQPSWLVAWSMNQDNHAILRGKWVRERLLGNVVPDIPITVDAQLPDAPEKTLRERMQVTEVEYCWQCHKLMNPVGLPFETFDHFGRYRVLEKGKPVDASGWIDLTGDKNFRIYVTNALDLAKNLAESERVEQVFIRHVFRYLAGRNENLGDGPSLQAAHRAYQESGGSFKALIVAILSSDSFLYRTPETEDIVANPDEEKS